MSIKALRRQLEDKLDNAKNIINYHRIATRFLHIMSDSQIERMLIAISRLYDAGVSVEQRRLFVSLILCLSAYIKDEWLQHIPGELAQQRPPIILRTMPRRRKILSSFMKKLDLLSFLSASLVLPTIHNAGKLYARISPDIKMRLALIFENLPVRRIFSSEERNRLMRERAVLRIKEL